MAYNKKGEQRNTGRTHFKKGQVSFNKGVLMSDEQKKKISESKKGKSPAWNKGRKSPWTSERNRINNPQKKGEKNYHWKGGRDIYNKIQAKIRDDYTCQICGMREPEIMQVDHIKPKSIFPELRHEMNNLMTLCPNCHARKTIREKKQKYDKNLY